MASVPFLQDMFPLRIFYKISFELTLRIWDLNSDAIDSFLLSHMFDLTIYIVYIISYTEFRSDTLTVWAIRPWVQLALRANFVQLLQFLLFVQCSLFISVFAFGLCLTNIYIYIYIVIMKVKKHFYLKHFKVSLFWCTFVIYIFVFEVAVRSLWTLLHLKSATQTIPLFLSYLFSKLYFYQN